jgi:hypothetical protein
MTQIGQKYSRPAEAIELTAQMVTTMSAVLSHGRHEDWLPPQGPPTHGPGAHCPGTGPQRPWVGDRCSCRTGSAARARSVAGRSAVSSASSP